MWMRASLARENRSGLRSRWAITDGTSQQAIKADLSLGHHHDQITFSNYPMLMTYAEASYFDSAHFAHIAAWEQYRFLAHRRRKEQVGVKASLLSSVSRDGHRLGGDLRSE